LQLAILFAILSARAIIFAGGSSLWIRFSDSIRQRKIIPGENSSMLLAQEVLRGFAILLLDASFFVLLLRVGFFHFAEYSQKLFWLGFI
ncbi:hypothetical protein C1Y02_30585, partial [Pseudomonas sp. FW306-02-F04-AA]|uniref:hypothetical protein n=1 Tax=Pseudomonas sp. FW306-02-F04-AA TaxID=2070658 RepID=UPI000CAFD7D6